MPSDTVMVLKVTALAPAASTPGRRQAGELVDVHVAGREIAPGRGDADLRLLEIGLAEAHGMQHGASRRLFDAIDHQARVRPDVDGAAGRGFRCEFFFDIIRPSRSVSSK